MSEEEAGTPVARSAPGTDGLWNTQVSWGQGREVGEVGREWAEDPSEGKEADEAGQDSWAQMTECSAL